CTSHSTLLSMRFFFSIIRPRPRSTLFPYTTLCRSPQLGGHIGGRQAHAEGVALRGLAPEEGVDARAEDGVGGQCHVEALPEARRSEEHTSELQSRGHLVCRLLLEKKKKVT